MHDVNKLIEDLARERPVFHSEADFQHALALHINKVVLNASVRLEYKPDREKREYIDLWLPSREVAVELKYLTRGLDFDHKCERFSLRDQGAQDTRRYDFLKDIQRLEQLSASKRTDVQAGLAILLTNDHLYWDPPTRETNDAQFRLHAARTIKGKMEWSPETSPGTKKGREAPICLRDPYDLKWQEYSEVGDGASRRFRYLAIHVGCPSTLDKREPCLSATKSATGR